jgi:DNA-binding protein HU-beta
VLYFARLVSTNTKIKEETVIATLRKIDLVGRVSSKLGGTKAGGDAALTAVLESVQEALAAGNKVVLTGFGTFEVRQVKQRRVRPIRGGGTTVEIPAHKRVGFVPGANLKGAVSGKR